jgi:hypothetical protein
LVKPDVSSIGINFSDSSSVLGPENGVFFYIRVRSCSSLSLEHGNSSVISWAHPVGQEGSSFAVNIDVSLSDISSVDQGRDLIVKSSDQIPLRNLFSNSSSEPLKGLPFKEFEKMLELIISHVVEGGGLVPVITRRDPVFLGNLEISEEQHSVVNVVETVP